MDLTKWHKDPIGAFPIGKQIQLDSKVFAQFEQVRNYIYINQLLIGHENITSFIISFQSSVFLDLFNSLFL